MPSITEKAYLSQVIEFCTAVQNTIKAKHEESISPDVLTTVEYIIDQISITGEETDLGWMVLVMRHLLASSKESLSYLMGPEVVGDVQEGVQQLDQQLSEKKKLELTNILKKQYEEESWEAMSSELEELSLEIENKVFEWLEQTVEPGILKLKKRFQDTNQFNLEYLGQVVIFFPQIPLLRFELFIKDLKNEILLHSFKDRPCHYYLQVLEEVIHLRADYPDYPEFFYELQNLSVNETLQSMEQFERAKCISKEMKRRRLNKN